ncbi:MAG: phosphatase PAP2 family protein [Acidobacteria bacterium]|jgi:undecaprenyl-diphosphatase|nr:phosphatase PAP2 family protein [Acidobacteriota bacterium]
MSENSDDKQASWSKFSFRKVVALILQFFGWRLFAGLVAAIICLLFFARLAESVFENETISFDQTVRGAVHNLSNPALTEAMKFFSVLGSTLFLIALGVLVAAAFFYLLRKRALVLFLATTLGSTIILTVLKATFQRARPDAYFDYALPLSYSFPSGHSLSSLCFYGILAWLVAARLKNKAAKIAVWTFAAALILLIGLSRVYLGVHYPSDVLAGYAAGVVWVVTVGLGDFFLQRKETDKI